jgi:endonuclease-3
MNQAKRQAIFATLQALNPEPRTELNYRNPFELLIAVILSAQATDVSVNKATHTLFQIAPSPEKMLSLGLERLSDAIRTIGLYRSKAKHILATCEILMTQHQGQVPKQREALEALPGVGRKTANVVLNTAFGAETIAVDTHIFRLANRIGLARGKTVTAVEQKLLKTVPKEYLRNAHHWLILHGRYICKARRPECWHCAIEPLCEFRDKRLTP